MTITGTQSQQIDLKKNKSTMIVFDYEGDFLMFEGQEVKAMASLKTISDAFWMVLSLTAKGFVCEPNEPKAMFEKVFGIQSKEPASLEKKTHAKHAEKKHKSAKHNKK